MGKVTGTQLDAALEAVSRRSRSDQQTESETAENLMRIACVPAENVRGAALWLQVGMELVRRYGVLALDDANLPGLVPAEYGPAAQVVLSEVAHRNGYHVALVSRTEFEEFLGLEAGGLTDQQWMELDDRLAQHFDWSPGWHRGMGAYVEQTVRAAGWRRETLASAWVYRPGGWDQS